MEMENAEDTDFDLVAFFDMTPDLACIAGKDGYFRKINPSVAHTLGYTMEELYASPIHTFIHPDDQEMTSRERAKLLSGKRLLNFENRYLTKSGEVVWLEWTSVYFSAKEVVFAVAKNVTARKRSEADIEAKYARFRNLANYFKTSIQEDRKYLAIEIHEELAQLTYAMKLDIDWQLMNMKQLPESAKKRIEHVSSISHLLITTMRKISFELYPNMLSDMGLRGSLQWLCKEFSSLNNIPCLLEANYQEENLQAEYKVDFFRICQESLSNIMYHAEATEVKVSVWEQGRQFCLAIADNGKGFDIDQYHQSPGMLSMRERANSINGHLKIDSEMGKGTCVSMVLET